MGTFTRRSRYSPGAVGGVIRRSKLRPLVAADVSPAATVDLLIALEVAIRKRAHLSLVQTFLEYKRVKRGSHIINETMDYVDSIENSGE